MHTDTLVFFATLYRTIYLYRTAEAGAALSLLKVIMRDGELVRISNNLPILTPSCPIPYRHHVFCSYFRIKSRNSTTFHSEYLSKYLAWRRVADLLYCGLIQFAPVRCFLSETITLRSHQTDKAHRPI